MLGGGSNAHKNYVRREVICGTELYTRASYARALVIHKGIHTQRVNTNWGELLTHGSEIHTGEVRHRWVTQRGEFRTGGLRMGGLRTRGGYKWRDLHIRRSTHEGI